jgi:hypothetical protein
MSHPFQIGQRVRIGRVHDPEWAYLEGRNGIIETTSLYTDDPAEDPEAEGPYLGVWLRDGPGRDGRNLYVFDFDEVLPR